ncbi:MAG: hypothetical protein WAO69_08715 [Aestuariivita sp.]|uniref:hypothetical protein n=1 Tax=Aestuariivita sp. TaxID=1872407 RepID=UPI003BAE47F2
MNIDDILKAARARKRETLDGTAPLDPIGARIVIDEACKGNPRLRAAIDLLLNDRQALIEEYQVRGKEYFDQDRTSKGNRERWADKPNMKDLVSRIAVDALSRRSKPFESVMQCAREILDEVNTHLDVPTTANAVRAYIPKKVTGEAK